MRTLLLAFSLVVITASNLPAAFAFRPFDELRVGLSNVEGRQAQGVLSLPGDAKAAASLDEAEPSLAQEVGKPPSGDANVKPPEQAVNPDELGVSIDRIRLRFRRNSLFNNVFDPDRLKLTAYVDVVAKAPEIKLFGADPRTAKEQLTSRAVPFGAPTHRDVVQMLTPPEFRTPPMDMTALINWLAQQLQKKDEK